MSDPDPLGTGADNLPPAPTPGGLSRPPATPPVVAVAPAPEPAAPAEPPAPANIYRNTYITAIFTAAGMCKPGQCIELTPEEVKAFGDLVRPA